MFMYKCCRMVFCSYVFYFMPFTVVWVPYMIG